MTTVLGSLTIPRASAVPTTRPATKLNEFRGCLKKPLTQSLKPLSHTPSQKFSPSRRFSVACEAQNTANLAPAITESTWQSLVLESDSPVLVEFWAPWCGPCRMIHPIIDELAKQYAGKFKFYKVNTDESHSIANQYGIRSIPTVMIFQNGEKKDAVIGAVPKTTLTNCIEKFL